MSSKKLETTTKQLHKIVGKENLERGARIQMKSAKVRFDRKNNLNTKPLRKFLGMRSTLDGLLRAPTPPIIAGRRQRRVLTQTQRQNVTQLGEGAHVSS